MTFQPRRTTVNLTAAGGLKPSQNKLPAQLWMGAKVRQITTVSAVDVKVDFNGVSVSRPPASRRASAPVTPAGGAR